MNIVDEARFRQMTVICIKIKEQINQHIWDNQQINTEEITSEMSIHY
jgi:hypothetical protein